MVEIISCFLIAVALSMDTFSLSLGLGTYNIKQKDCLKLSLMVGVMHFLMPLIGNNIGSNLINFFSINSNRLLGFILLFLAINLFISLLKDETLEADVSLLGMFFFSFGVSIDAFSTGLGLHAITSNIFLATTIFSITSFLFTLLGLLIGKFASTKLGKKASILGFILLLSISVYHLCK